MSPLRLALFGQPVSHSPSPGVHQAFAAQVGLEVEYRLIEASPEAFRQRLQEFRSAGGSGCNITLPLKHIAFELADQRSDRAGRAGAANTLWWSADGRCHADNTDGAGLVRGLENNRRVTIEGKRVLLVGAGGAAAGVLGPLLERRPALLVIANRTVKHAQTLAQRHQGLGELRCLPLADIDACTASHLVIDATSMGHSGAPPGIPATVLEGAGHCCSLNYGAAAEPLRGLCGQLGVPFSDGLGMLVEQAAISFEIWTGRRPHTAPVLASLERADME